MATTGAMRGSANLRGLGDVNRKSYILSVTPVDFSLTDDTNIPPPSRPLTPAESPISGGGPLSSHPPSTASTTASGRSGAGTRWTDARNSTRPNAVPAASPRTAPPASPPSRPRGMRKILSLSSLRSSFAGSRSSLLFSRPSHDVSLNSGVKRPSSPTDPSAVEDRAQMRQRRSSSSWFKRRSSLFILSNSDDLAGLEDPAAIEPGYITSSEPGYARPRFTRPAPTLPDISELGGGAIGDGSLAWDDTIFKT